MTERDLDGRRAVEEELRLRADLQGTLNSLLQLGLEDLPLDEQLHRALVALVGLPCLPLAPHAVAFLGRAPVAAVGLSSLELPPAPEPGRCPCGREPSLDLTACPALEGGPEALRWPHLALPLVAAGRPLGLLLLHLRGGPWPAAGRPFLRAAASALAALVARQSAEEAAREGADQLRQVAQNLPGVVFQLELRPEGTFHVAWVSQGLRETFGIAPGDMTAAADPFGFVASEDREALLQAVATSAAELSGLSAEVRVPVPGGQVRWALIRSTPRRRADGGVTWSGVALDVTERKRTEAELQRAKEAAEAADQAKLLFLANVSHELRTPLNAVIGMTGLLLESRLEPQERDYARTIRAGSEQLLLLIDDLLDFASIETGRLELARGPFGLRECIEGAMALLAERAAQQRLVLSWVEEDERVPLRVVGDEGRLRQVLVNLLGNAVKFTERGEVALEVGARPLADGRVELRFRVRDTGVGIAPERMDRLFKAFSQVDPSTTRRFGGTGLGLVISKRIVEHMGGTMGVESRPGHGSTFWFTCPLEPEREAPAAPPPELAGRRLLLGAGHAGTRDGLTREARRLGLLVQAEAGADALCRALSEAGWDALLLDQELLAAEPLRAAIIGRQSCGSLPLVLLYAPGAPQGEGVASLAVAARLMKPPALSQLGPLLAGLTAPRREAATRSPADPVAGTRILLAEDQEVNRRVVTALLAHLGFSADLARDGEEAVALATARPYDLVLMDLQMPRVDGLTAARRIRAAAGARSRRARIVAITASALEEERQRCREAGIDEVLVKPIGLQDLDALLQRLVSRAGPSRAPGQGEVERELARGPAAQLGSTGLSELAAAFLEDAPPLLRDLRGAAWDGRGEATARAAHALRGSCLTLGLSRAADLCLELEQAARGGEMPRARERLAALERSLADAERALRALSPGGQVSGVDRSPE